MQHIFQQALVYLLLRFPPQPAAHCFVFFVFGPELRLSTSEHTTGINKSQTIGRAGGWKEECRKSCRPTLAAENSFSKNRKIEIIIATATESDRFFVVQRLLPKML